MAIVQARMRFVHGGKGCIEAEVMHASIPARERDALTVTPLLLSHARQRAPACVIPMMFAFAGVDKARDNTRMLRRGIVADADDLWLANTGRRTRGSRRRCGERAECKSRMQVGP